MHWQPPECLAGLGNKVWDQEGCQPWKCKAFVSFVSFCRYDLSFFK
jgi:hypothetical protein